MRMLFLALILHCVYASQDGGGRTNPPPLPPPLPVKNSGPAAAGPVGAPLQPGVLPAEATPEARAAWERVCRANLDPTRMRSPVSAFELALDVRYRGQANGTNDFDAVYRFLAPGYVRIAVAGKRDLIRGPEGDWLVDRAREETIKLDVDRAYAEDRRQLDETLSVARTFVALTDPRSLRIASLASLPGAPTSLPEPLRKRAAELGWLCLRSPDFRLVDANLGSGVSRVTLGFDPKTGTVETAVVEEDSPSPALLRTARVVELRGAKPIQGFSVPQQILVYSPEEGRTPPGFAATAGMDLWIKRADLRTALKPEDFSPQRR